MENLKKLSAKLNVNKKSVPSTLFSHHFSSAPGLVNFYIILKVSAGNK